MTRGNIMNKQNQSQYVLFQISAVTYLFHFKVFVCLIWWMFIVYI